MAGAGNLRHRVQLFDPIRTTASDGSGQPTTTWRLVATVWASAECVSGQQAEVHAQQAEHRRWKFVMRSTPTTRTVDAKWRVDFGRRQCQVVTAMPDGQTQIVIEATEKPA